MPYGAVRTSRMGWRLVAQPQADGSDFRMAASPSPTGAGTAKSPLGFHMILGQTSQMDSCDSTSPARDSERGAAAAGFLAGILAAVIGGVVVYAVTEGLSDQQASLDDARTTIVTYYALSVIKQEQPKAYRALLTENFRENHNQDGDARFFETLESVDVEEVSAVDAVPNAFMADLTYTYDDGRVVTERTRVTIKCDRILPLLPVARCNQDWLRIDAAARVQP